MHKNDRDQQAKALMELYKEHGVNPFSGILLLLYPDSDTAHLLLGDSLRRRHRATNRTIFLHRPTANIKRLIPRLHRSRKAEFNPHHRRRARAIFSGEACHLSSAGQYAAPLSQAEKIARQMVFVGPIITILVFYNFPAALGLYWLMSALFSAVQQYFVNKHLQKKYGA